MTPVIISDRQTETGSHYCSEMAELNPLASAWLPNYGITDAGYRIKYCLKKKQTNKRGFMFL